MDGIRFPENVDFSYNPELDLQEVDQFGFIDLREAYDKGILPGSADLLDDSFNGVDNPSVLMNRSQDVFDAIRQAQYVHENLEGLAKRERESAEAAAAAAAANAGA